MPTRILQSAGSMRSLSHHVGRPQPGRLQNGGSSPARYSLAGYSLANNVPKRMHFFPVDCLFQGGTASITATPPQSSAPLHGQTMPGCSCLIAGGSLSSARPKPRPVEATAPSASGTAAFGARAPGRGDSIAFPPCEPCRGTCRCPYAWNAQQNQRMAAATAGRARPAAARTPARRAPAAGPGAHPHRSCAAMPWPPSPPLAHARAPRFARKPGRRGGRPTPLCRGRGPARRNDGRTPLKRSGRRWGGFCALPWLLRQRRPSCSNSGASAAARARRASYPNAE
jgi:hypothetical protein